MNGSTASPSTYICAAYELNKIPIIKVYDPSELTRYITSMVWQMRIYNRTTYFKRPAARACGWRSETGISGYRRGDIWLLHGFTPNLPEVVAVRKINAP